MIYRIAETTSTNDLIDCSTGEVVARELRGKVLAETLGELFKQ